MQNDDTPKNGNDDFDEDFDFEELDEDDAADDSWDEAEDAEDLDIESTEGTSPAKNKTFLQKNFNMIVIGGAVLLGAAFVLPMLIGGGPVATQTDPNAVQETAAAPQEAAPPIAEIGELQHDVPPMPAPINGVPEEAGQDVVLTPMPEPTMAAEQPPPPLELPAESLPDMPPQDSQPVLEEPVLEAAPIETPAPAAPAETAIVDPLEAPAPAEAPLAAGETIIPDLPPEPAAAAPVETPAPAEPLAEEITAAPVDTSAKEAEIAALNGRLSEADAKMNEMNATIGSLQSQIEELKAAKEQSEARASEAEAKARTAEDAARKAAEEAAKTAKGPEQAAPAPEKKEQVAAPAPKAKPLIPEEKPAPILKPKTESPAPALSATPNWTLKGARPGRATIAKKGSEDVLIVEVGESVKGLGKITSIAQENGKWVVRGTQGSVSQ